MCSLCLLFVYTLYMRLKMPREQLNADGSTEKPEPENTDEVVQTENQEPSLEAKKLAELEAKLETAQKEKSELAKKAKTQESEIAKWQKLGVSQDDVSSMLEMKRQKDEKKLIEEGDFEKYKAQVNKGFENKLAEIKAEYEEQLAAIKNEAVTAKSELDKHYIHGAIRKTIGSDVLSEDALNDVIRLTESKLQRNGNEIIVVDDEGNNSMTPVENFLAEFKQNKPYLFKGRTTSGNGVQQQGEANTGSPQYKYQQALDKRDFSAASKAAFEQLKLQH